MRLDFPAIMGVGIVIAIVYLGANQDAFAEGQNLGIDQMLNVNNRYRGATFKNHEASPAAMQQCALGAAGDARSWKAGGNQTAAVLQGDGKPDEALSDGAQSLKFEEYEQMVREVRQIHDVISHHGA